MGHQVLGAFIVVVTNLITMNSYLPFKLDIRLLEEAKVNPKPYFLEDIEIRAKEQGIDRDKVSWSYLFSCP